MTNSRTIHSPRTRTKSSCHKKSKRLNSKSYFFLKNVIIVVIISAALSVAMALLLIPTAGPENKVKTKITEIATDYYENYLYPKTIELIQDKDTSTILKNYEKSGFANTRLRQLFLYNNEKYKDSADFIENFCDPDATYVKIYPSPPFGKTDYSIEYSYACSF